MRTIFMILTALNLAGVLGGIVWIFESMAGQMMLGVMVVAALGVWMLIQIGLVLVAQVIADKRAAK